MAAADVANYLEVNNPTMEVVVLTASDGETYTSKKFGKLTAAIATSNSDSDAELNVTLSGAVATINFASVSDGTVALMLFGNK